MNILVISENFTIGGLETNIYTQYTTLKDKHNFIFSFGNYKKNYDFGNSMVYNNFNFGPTVSIKEFYDDVEKLIKIIYDNSIDIIHVHPFFSFFPAVFASQITNTPIVYTFHGYGSYSFPEANNQLLLFNYFLENCINKIFVVSKTGYDYLKNHNSLDNVTLLPNAIDLKLYKPHKIINNHKWALISRLDNDKCKEIIMILKNINELKIKKIDIYGEGNCSQFIKNFINDNNLNDKVELKGYCANIYNQLDHKYNGIIGIGRVIMEGIAMGYPTIIIGYNKISGIVDLQTYDNIKQWNFVTKSLDNVSPDELNKQLSDVYKNIEKYQYIDRIKNEFSADVIFEKYQNEIKDITFNEYFGILPLYKDLGELVNHEGFTDESFYNSRKIYDLLKKNLGNWVLTSNVKNTFANFDNYYKMLDKHDELQSIVNNLTHEIKILKNRSIIAKTKTTLKGTILYRIITKIRN